MDYIIIMMNESKYSIKIVSRLTGLSTFVIRAWEKRYNVVSPARTGANRRFYTDTDVQKLRLLSQATGNGFNIGSIANLSIEDLTALIQKNKVFSSADNSGELNSIHGSKLSVLLHEYLNACLDAVLKLDQIKFENILIKAAAELNRDYLINDLVIPLINEIGDRWDKGKLRIANEHMASSVLIAFLQNLRGVYKTFQDGPVMIIGTPQGQMHELGALIVAVTAASQGWKVVYLGANLPCHEILSVAENLQAKMICLSLVYPEEDNQTKLYLTELRRMTNEKIKIVIGGRAALSYRETADNEGLILVQDINTFHQKLTEMREDINNPYTGIN